MTGPHPLNVAILGGGKGGSALLDLLIHMQDIAVIGLADTNPAAPGYLRAKDLHLKVTTSVVDLITDDSVNLIVDVTGDPTVAPLIHNHKQPGVEVLSGAAARLLWNLVRHETHMQAQVFHAEKLATIGTFASGLAHDINNPLYLILGLAENLQEEKNPAVIKEQARDIAETVRGISALSKDLTQYARYPSSQELVDIEITTKLEEALKIARYATVLQDLSIVKAFADKLIIKAQPEEILHVFVNLMTNAIQAMEGKGTLTLGTHSMDGRAKVIISDTGCGIPKENLEKIFDPFFTTKPPGKGTGLGLHSVRTVVAKLNGTVFVETEAGKGTTFRLEFKKA